MTARWLTQEQLLDEAASRFGPDPMNIAFQCPVCGDIARIREFPSDAFGKAGQECIGRSLGALEEDYQGRGCDWAAYGLIPGPWTVVMLDGKEIRSFELAPAEASEGQRL